MSGCLVCHCLQSHTVTPNSLTHSSRHSCSATIHFDPCHPNLGSEISNRLSPSVYQVAWQPTSQWHEAPPPTHLTSHQAQQSHWLQPSPTSILVPETICQSQLLLDKGAHKYPSWPPSPSFASPNRHKDASTYKNLFI